MVIWYSAIEPRECFDWRMVVPGGQVKSNATMRVLEGGEKREKAENRGWHHAAHSVPRAGTAGKRTIRMTKTVLALMRGSGPSTRPSSSSVIAAFVLVVAAAAPFFLEWGSYASETNLPLTLLLTGRRVAMMISKKE